MGNAAQAGRFFFRLSPSLPTVRVLRAIDVSSAQPRDLSAIIAEHNPDLVIVKHYQPEEHFGAGWTPSMTQQWTLDQVASVKACGKVPLAYFWLYADLDPRRAVGNTLELMAKGGVDILFDAPDVETYGAAQSIPGEHVIAPALDELDKNGAGDSPIYSSSEMWRRIGSPMTFKGRKSWGAGGDRYNTGGEWPESLDDAPRFGGLEPIGHQFTSVPLDRSIFMLAAA